VRKDAALPQEQAITETMLAPMATRISKPSIVVRTGTMKIPLAMPSAPPTAIATTEMQNSPRADAANISAVLAAPTPGNQFERSGTTPFGSDAKNKTTQTQRRTMSLYRNSPVRFHAIGSVDKLHFTTPGVEKKNDHVIAKVPIPINEPSADSIGINAPAARRAAVVNSTTPSR
jgi:hypothetical protein